MDTELAEVRRIALAAQDIATKADHKAESSLLLQSSHEKVCAERYQAINKQLDAVAQNQKDAATAQVTALAQIWQKLDTLSGAVSQAKGMELLFRIACMAVGAAGVFYGMK
jgi:hypothetical protein